MIIDSHWFALCLSQGPVRLDGVTYYLRNGRVCVRPSHHKKRGKRSEAELATTGRFVEMRKLWTMYRRAVGELPVWRVAAREVGAGQGDTLFHRLNAGCVRSGEGVWAFPAFRFAAGSLDMPVLREARRERGIVTLEWTKTTPEPGGPTACMSATFMMRNRVYRGLSKPQRNGWQGRQR